jgi:hypothetical protein
MISDLGHQDGRPCDDCHQDAATRAAASEEISGRVRTLLGPVAGWPTSRRAIRNRALRLVLAPTRIRRQMPEVRAEIAMQATPVLGQQMRKMRRKKGNQARWPRVHK